MLSVLVLKLPLKVLLVVADNFRKAQARIPKKKVRQTVIDPDTGKKTTKLTFEEQAKPPSKLSHAVRGAPANALLAGAHKENRKSEQDNVGVEGAHKTEQAVEVSARLVWEGYRSHKLKPYREAAKAEQKLEKANINALYQKSLAADIITDGCNMGIKSLYKYLHQYPKAEQKVKDLTGELIRAEETLVEDLREYL